jgi:hypothetical protein
MKFSNWIVKPLRWLGAFLKFLFRVLVLAWASLAIYYSNLPWPTARLVLAVLFAVFGVWALWIARRPRGTLIFAGAFVLLIGWWMTIQPSHDRPWRPEVAVMPRAVIDGDRVRIINYRNFEFRSRDDFTPRYEEREFLLSHLTGVDFYVSYWKEGPVGHTFLSFMFDNAPPLSMSIETRPEVGEGFDPLASLFKQFELIYVVGDERDLVRLRTNFRDEDVYLYRLNIPPAAARQLLLVYLKRINQLADKAEFYHLLTDSCTINIVRYANAAGREGRLDIRHVLNGWFDRYLYRAGWINTTLSFDELRRRSHINEASIAAGDGPDYYERIRKDLPTVRP